MSDLQAIDIPENALEFSNSRSGGPGGQGVNRTESKVELRFELASAHWIPPPIRARFRRLAASYLTRDDEIVISSEIHRSRLRNRDECLRKLRALLQQAAIPPKVRKKTKASKSAKRKRLDSKTKRGDVKRKRAKIRYDD